MTTWEQAGRKLDVDRLGSLFLIGTGLPFLLWTGPRVPAGGEGAANSS